MLILVAEVDSRRLAFRLTDISEVVRAVAVTAVPGVAAVVEGVIDFRGTVVPVVNVRRRFGLAPREATLADRFVIVRAEGRQVALRVDAAEEVAELKDETITIAEGLWAAGAQVSGVVRLAGGLLLLGELDAFLSQTEADALDQALTAQAQPA